MSVQVEKLEHNMAKLTITVPAETFNKAITQAYKKMKNQISIPGFRKGKVPQAMVEKMYGAGMFYEDAANIVIPEEYDKALAEVKDIKITSQPAIDVTQMEKGKDFIFTAEVATKPEVTLGQYKGIEVPENKVEVTDEEIEAELKKVQEQNAREITVDRPAENGDTVVIDFEGSVDGEVFEGGTAENHPLVLGSGSFIPGFEDQLVGATADSDVEVNATFPEDYQAKDLAGKAAVFKVKVHEIKKKELPEINDEFAQDVSEFDTLAEYKEDLKKKLTERKETAAKNAKEAAAVEAAVANAEMDIPDAMVDGQVRQMANDFARRIQSQGLTVDQYFQFTGMTAEKLMDQMKPEALKRIKNSLVLEAVAAKENFEIAEEKIEEELKKMSEAYKMEVDKIKEALGESGLDQMKADLKIQAAVDFIRDKAKEVEKKAEEEKKED